jgi:hypothetical protein
MPVKPENKARYPADWGAIAEAVKAEAGWRCEQCGVAHGEVIWRGTDAGRPVFRRPEDPEFCESLDAATGAAVPGTCHDTFEGRKPVRIIATVAHLDHQPENIERGNLRCLCQRCHLAYDSAHHAVNAAATRRAKKALGDFFSTRET